MNLQEAIDSIGQTYYEKEKNITIIDKKIILNKGDLVCVGIKKSTNETGLVILFRASRKSDKWLLWYPSENQVNNLNEVQKLYGEVNNDNSKFWGKKE